MLLQYIVTILSNYTNLDVSVCTNIPCLCAITKLINFAARMQVNSTKVYCHSSSDLLHSVQVFSIHSSCSTTTNCTSSTSLQTKRVYDARCGPVVNRCKRTRHSAVVEIAGVPRAAAVFMVEQQQCRYLPSSIHTCL